VDEDSGFKWIKPIPLEIFQEVDGIVRSFQRNFPKGALIIYLMFDMLTETFYVDVPKQRCQSLSVNAVDFESSRRVDCIACGCFIFPFDAEPCLDVWMPNGFRVHLYLSEKGVLIQKVRVGNAEIIIPLSEITDVSQFEKAEVLYSATSIEALIQHRKASSWNRLGRYFFNTGLKKKSSLAIKLGSWIIKHASRKLNTSVLKEAYYLPKCIEDPKINWEEIYDYAGVSGMFVGIPVQFVIEHLPAKLEVVS